MPAGESHAKELQQIINTNPEVAPDTDLGYWEMRNKLICLAFFSLLAHGFVACNKDEKEPAKPQKKIEKITILEDNAGRVSTMIYRFLYDGNRLTDIYQDVNIGYKYYLGVNYSTNNRKYSFKYDGDLLKMIEIDGSSKELVSLSYNTNGQLKNIECGTSTLQITWNDGYPVTIGNDTLTWSEGDLMSVAGETKAMRFIYDANSSQFNMSMSNRIIMMYLGGWSFNFGFECNNLLGINPSFHNVVEEQTSYYKYINEYKYTTDGYPLSRKSYATDASNSFKESMRYAFYTYTDGDGADVPKSVKEIW